MEEEESRLGCLSFFCDYKMNKQKWRWSRSILGQFSTNPTKYELWVVGPGAGRDVLLFTAVLLGVEALTLLQRA